MGQRGRWGPRMFYDGHITHLWGSYYPPHQPYEDAYNPSQPVLRPVTRVTQSSSSRALLLWSCAVPRVLVCLLLWLCAHVPTIVIMCLLLCPCAYYCDHVPVPTFVLVSEQSDVCCHRPLFQDELAPSDSNSSLLENNGLGSLWILSYAKVIVIFTKKSCAA